MEDKRGPPDSTPGEAPKMHHLLPPLLIHPVLPTSYMSLSSLHGYTNNVELPCITKWLAHFRISYASYKSVLTSAEYLNREAFVIALLMIEATFPWPLPTLL